MIVSFLSEKAVALALGQEKNNFAKCQLPPDHSASPVCPVPFLYYNTLFLSLLVVLQLTKINKVLEGHCHGALRKNER